MRRFFVIMAATALWICTGAPSTWADGIWQPPTYGEKEVATVTVTATHTVTQTAVQHNVERITERVTEQHTVHSTVHSTERETIHTTPKPEVPVELADNLAAAPLGCNPVGIPVQGDEGPPPISADELAHAHQFATGKGVKVAIIDTGIAPHPRLAGRIHSLSGEHVDCDGHGTVVAGIIGAAPGSGVTGIAPQATLIDVPDRGGNLESLADAIIRAVDAGAHVINISIVGCFSPDRPANTAGVDRALGYAERENVVVIGAAGNIGDGCEAGSVVYPAHAPTVISVGAVDNGYAVAGYSVADPSRFGVNAPGAMHMGLAAQGGGFIRALATDRPLVGTSFAAPVVSGAAALLRERYPEATAAEIRQRIAGAKAGSSGTIEISRVMSALPYDPHYRLEAVSYERPQERPAANYLLIAGAGLLGALCLLVPLVYRASRRFDGQVGANRQ
ncbi:MAG: S8 family serine peptidase [Corynebacterium sp.]|nr:S8 family serine peptidase [Corynebacterium sp.]